jgi:elongation factor G
MAKERERVKQNPFEHPHNFGTEAHIDAGQTTTERILYDGGVVHKMSEVHEATWLTDWIEQEQRWGIMITSTRN